MLTKKYLDEFLSDLEQKKIESFVQDKELVSAIEKVLLFSLYNSGTIAKGKTHNPMHNFALVLASQRPELSDAEIGSNIKACWSGINALKLAFDDLKMYEPIPVDKLKGNNAR